MATTENTPFEPATVQQLIAQMQHEFRIDPLIQEMERQERHYFRQIRMQEQAAENAKRLAEAKRIQDAINACTTFEICLQFKESTKRQVEYFEVEGLEEAMSIFNAYRKIGHALKMDKIYLSTTSNDDKAEVLVKKVTFTYN